jgi:hypothetical protein
LVALAITGQQPAKFGPRDERSAADVGELDEPSLLPGVKRGDDNAEPRGTLTETERSERQPVGKGDGGDTTMRHGTVLSAEASHGCGPVTALQRRVNA